MLGMTSIRARRTRGTLIENAQEQQRRWAFLNRLTTESIMRHRLESAYEKCMAAFGLWA